MKTIVTIIGLALGLIQTVAFAAEQPAWSLEGRMIIADSCGVDCHCLIGGPPDNGLCQFFLIGQIDNGQYAGVKLDGVKIGQAREFVQKMMGEQPKFTFTAEGLAATSDHNGCAIPRDFILAPHQCFVHEFFVHK